MDLSTNDSTQQPLSISNRRRSLDRRIGERRLASERPALDVAAGGHRLGPDRRLHDRRVGDRRTAVAGQTAPVINSDVPQLVCPVCHGPLEYEAMLSWALPDTYTVSTGYCPTCSRRFFQTRETGDYDSLSWPPLCRVCREPIGYVQDMRAQGTVKYRCQYHPAEEWLYRPSDGQWTRPSVIT